MAKYPLTDRQKDMIRSLAPGLRDGKVDTDWTIMHGEDRIFSIYGLDNNGKLWREVWDGVKDSDFVAFGRCGFVDQMGEENYSLNEYLILNAVDHDFADDDKTQGTQINISGGDFRGSNVNIASTLTNVQQSISSSSLDDEVKAQLSQLVGELKETLAAAKLPDDEAEEAEALAHHVQVAVDQLNASKPNKRLIKSSVDEFVKGIQNVGRILPPIIAIGTQIATILHPYVK